MSKKPRGEPASCEAGLRALAARRGPSEGRLAAALEFPESDNDSELFVLMTRTSGIPHDAAAVRAAALWEVIQEEIQKLASEDDKLLESRALAAAFRIPMETYRGPKYDSIVKRLDLAQKHGQFDPSVSGESLVKLWRLAVRKLGHRLERRLVDLEKNPDGWLVYPSVPQVPLQRPFPDPQADAPSSAQPLYVDRLAVTYRMNGRSVEETTTERLVTATDEVDRYVVRAYSPGGGDHNVKVEALLNCRPGAVETFRGPNGGEIHEMVMFAPSQLCEGDKWFFASRVRHQLAGAEDPILEIQVTSRGIAPGGLTMRVQFAEHSHPQAAWWFADMPESRHRVTPPAGHRRRLTWSTLGFMEHTFVEPCRPLCKYGLAWEWQ